MSPLRKNNVRVSGAGDTAMVFAHGFGCDQHTWRHVAPAFCADFRTVLFDHVGAGRSDLSCYRAESYQSLQQYADDLLDICAALRLEGAVFVGHSVAAMIGVLAALKAPERFAKLVLIAPSPCYINDGDYHGGFDRADIEQLVDFVDDNFLGWSQIMAPAIMGNPERPELGAELTDSFCRADAAIARQFARVTFLSDHRAELARLRTPALILQCSDDPIAPEQVGRFMHRHLAGSTLVRLQASGHCPNLSAPAETVAAIKRYV